MSTLEPGRQLLSPVLRALSEAEAEGRISARVAEDRRRWATEHADADGVVAVPRGWALTDPPGTHGAGTHGAAEAAPVGVPGVSAPRSPGGRGRLLRISGVVVGVAVGLPAAWAGLRPAALGPDGVAWGEIAWGPLVSGTAEAVFYGGVLWAAGTVVGQLDALLRRA